MPLFSLQSPRTIAQNASEPIAMQPPDHQSRSLRAFATALVLLVISFLINYVDRGNLSIAAPLLSVELDLSPA